MEVRTLSNLAESLSRSRGLLVTREAVLHALVLPFVRGLGYDPADPREVRVAHDLSLPTGKLIADLALFDPAGERLRLVIDLRPLGGDMVARTPLAAALGHHPGLRLVMVTDGARTHLYGDLLQPGQLDEAPLFALNLADPDADLEHAAGVLARLHRDRFQPDVLVGDIEDQLLRRALVDRLRTALRRPGADPEFVRWLSEGIYPGKRTRPVVERLARLADEAVTPAILGVLVDDHLDALRRRLSAACEGVGRELGPQVAAPPSEPPIVRRIREIVRRAGGDPAEIVHRETTNYLAIGLRTPSRWFIRWFDGGRRRALTTLVPAAEARDLAAPFDVEDAPQSFGVSRILIDDPEQVWALGRLILRSLDLCRRGEQLALA